MRILAAIVVLALAGPQAGAADAPAWTLVWSDDFDTLDETRWARVASTAPTNDSLHAYLPEHAAVEDGVLVITSTDEPYQGLAYRSGQVISRHEQLHGRWEVRAKMPTSRGMWPAIWLLPDVARHNWPSGGEIDILENRGNQPLVTSSAFHYGTNPPYRHDFLYAEQRTTRLGRPENYHDDFHTYAVDWTERYLRFYVDGVHHFTVFDRDVDGFLSRSVKPMQLVINNAIGGTFLPDPDDTSVWPQRMEVDWVRVYRLDERPGEAVFTNGGFEADGGALTGWSLFGADLAAIQSAQASGEAVLEGGAALKLFGTFGNGERYSGVSQGITVQPGETVTASASALASSGDSIRGSDNRVLLKIEFYDSFGARYGAGMLGEREIVIADGQSKNDVWDANTLRAVAPATAVEARLVLVFDQPGSAGGSVYVDGVTFEVTDRLSRDRRGVPTELAKRVPTSNRPLWRRKVALSETLRP